MYKLGFYVPDTHLEQVKGAVFEAGAGRVGNYDHCCWQCLGQGQFRPLAGSDPFLGEVGVVETVPEYRVELVVANDLAAAAVAAMKRAHPYDEPAWDLVRLEQVFDVLDLYMWLSYRFADLMPDGVRVREIQTELDATIQQGVVNIVRLLRNSDVGRVVADDDGSSADRQRRHHRLQCHDDHQWADGESAGGGGEAAPYGKLAQRLLAQGLLTPKMMEELREEWTKAQPTSAGRRVGKRKRR